MIVYSPDQIDGIKVINEGSKIFNELITRKSVYHWETGNSMDPLLKDREYCLIKPINDPKEIKQGDAVFCKVSGNFMVHMVSAISSTTTKDILFQISSTSGYIFGWTKDVYGIAYSTNIFEADSEKKSQIFGF